MPRSPSPARVAGHAVTARHAAGRPRGLRRPPPAAIGEPAAFPTPPRSAWSAARFGITITDRSRFIRLLLPGFLIALGAGQLIPFLNVFIHGKFGLDLGELADAHEKREADEQRKALRGLTERIKDSELVVFENCAHAAIYENAEEFNARTLAFLTRHSG